MKDFIESPRFCIKHWDWKRVPRSVGAKPELIHTIVYSEEELIDKLRNIQGNYFVFNIAEKYEDKSYFDNIFLEERLKKEREQYEKLKQKFENE